MSRTVDEFRPQQLRLAIARYLVKHGLIDLSLRPLAKAVKSSPRGLLYHFGSKEKMVIEVLAEVRRQQRDSYGRVEAKTFAESCEIIWERMSAPDTEPFFRLFFEVYGIALRHPGVYKSFLRDTIEDWLRLIADPLVLEGYPRAEARAFATVILAALRGFMLDYCTTHDRPRVSRAVRLWLSGLDSLLPAPKKAR
ncbi:MAG TPA: TetR/AcrR family transcriptional regulator [Terriglobales bacterium]|nr:TetR/AcrR family transcriptional regulator [Terriglobales bacterium]